MPQKPHSTRRRLCCKRHVGITWVWSVTEHLERCSRSGTVVWDFHCKQLERSAIEEHTAQQPRTAPPLFDRLRRIHTNRCVHGRFTYCISPPIPCSLMPSGSFWSDACSNAVSRPLQALVNAAHASCGVTVRCAPAAAAPDVVCNAGSAVSTCV